jgi:hypothetical protein
MHKYSYKFVYLVNEQFLTKFMLLVNPWEAQQMVPSTMYG